jgi:hypothetical protein
MRLESSWAVIGVRDTVRYLPSSTMLTATH